MSLYAIGDIHGHLDKLTRAVDLIERDGGPDAEIVFVGDYTDRGPQSREVIDFLIEARSAGRKWTFLKGNHDRAFQYFMQPVPRFDPHMLVGMDWLHDRIGGKTTLRSYGVEIDERSRYEEVLKQAHELVPQSHLNFLDQTTMMHRQGDCVFVHAGIRPGIPLGAQAENDLLWIREPFLSNTDDHGPLIVHGHTALKHPQHYGNRINLDGGAAYGEMLHPAVFEGRDCWLLTDGGRVPLTRV
ncbi:metallophosphoesterase [Aestuariibius sp. HNIBRBA575]|uniref:metallophosphoesterase n=1 Tax=Aestuariibius sp. HNIBRBA575 TaxID=3233343 RepID=UPI0034A2E424